MKEIVTACQKLYERSLVANHDGNITFKIANDEFVATPTSFSKGDVTESDLLIIDDEGKVLRGKHKVFSEVAVHLAIYKARPDIRCVVHAHPPTASAFGISGKEIGTPVIPEAIVSLGRSILNLKNDTASEYKRVLQESDAFIVPANGAWTVGQNVMQTYYRMELVEHVAKQHFLALQLGPLPFLSETQVNSLVAKRPKQQISQIPLGLRDLVEEEVQAIYSQVK